MLNLFQESILIMDEVDLILHPMKSELNFPIGRTSTIMHVIFDITAHLSLK